MPSLHIQKHHVERIQLEPIDPNGSRVRERTGVASWLPLLPRGAACVVRIVGGSPLRPVVHEGADGEATARTPTRSAQGEYSVRQQAGPGRGSEVVVTGVSWDAVGWVRRNEAPRVRSSAAETSVPSRVARKKLPWVVCETYSHHSGW